MLGRQVPRPFLKWAGGKTQLLDELVRRVPKRFETYYEPFLGSGALFFHLYRLGMIKRAVLSDINKELIATYVAIRDSVQDVIDILSTFPYDRDHFYHLRSMDPDKLDFPMVAARMIYLNKTGYNGLYRVNRRGQFNVPFGSQCGKPKIVDRENLIAVSRALHSVEILCADFGDILARAVSNDFVYCDPPYVPISRTSSFTQYQPGGFTESDQIRLRVMCEFLSSNGVSVMISNSSADSVLSRFRPHGFRCEFVNARRFINSVGSKRGVVLESILTNYSIRLSEVHQNETFEDSLCVPSVRPAGGMAQDDFSYVDIVGVAGEGP